VNPIPPILIAIALAAPLCAMADGRIRTVPLRIESAAKPAGAPSVLVIDGLVGLPQDGGIIEVRAHARGVSGGDALLTHFAVLSGKTTSWRIVVDAPAAALSAITADPNATVLITACARSDRTRCTVISARSVTLQRNTNG
jgi:hypothetical protein